MALVTRSQWGAKPPSSSLSAIGKVDTVFIHHSVSNPTSDPKTDVRSIQATHMSSRKFADIAYTILVHPDGTILEGRADVGGKAAQGAHTSGYNSKSVAICAIGNYDTDAVPDSIIKGINEALGVLVSRGWCNPNARIRSHNEVFATACCGKYLRARLHEIKYGGSSTPPQPQGVTVAKSKVFEARIKTDNDGNGYADIYHGETSDPVGSFAQANGGISNGKYPDYTPLFWTAANAGSFVRVTIVKSRPGSEFSFKLHCDW